MKIFSLFGNPVQHSISPRIHNLVFKTLNINSCYTRRLVQENENLDDVFFSMKLSGANITIPHKENAFKLSHEVRGIAKKIGAVNTWILEDKKIVGFNTDAPGFIQSIGLIENFKNALILGAGGTAKAIAHALNEKGLDIVILNRSEKSLESFKNQGFKTYSWENFDANSNLFDLIINTTSAGLEEDILPAPIEILEKIVPKASYAYDVIYNKTTPFISMANKYGIKNKNGKDMLLYQAAFASEIFLNQKYEKVNIEEIMKKAFLLPR